MNEKPILIFACLFIIIGAILKITHTWEEGNSWVLIAGYFLGFIYFLFRAIYHKKS